MGNTSTFGTFTMARLGIYVAQHALNTTGNNISNINTKGYTREKLDQSSMYFGGADRYQSRYDVRENGGVMATGVEQIRDQYLDIRYRNEMTKVGEADMKVDGLKQLDVIFDEVAKGEDGEGVLEARFNDFKQQLEELSKDENAGNDDIDALVRSSAEALAIQFNRYAERLETLTKNETAQFKQELDATNATLEKIRDLNETIRKTQIFGGTGLTLKDERNVLIDELAEKIGINVIYEMENLGDGVEIEKLKITTSGDPSRTLIDGIYGAQLSIVPKNTSVGKLDNDGRPLSTDSRNVYDWDGGDNDNFDLMLSELVDSRGKVDPAKPNELETVYNVETFGELPADWSTVQEQVTVTTKAEAEEFAKNLNDQLGYTQGTVPYFHADRAPDNSGTPDDGRYVVHYHYDSKDADSTYSFAKVTASNQTKLSDTELSGGLQAMREMLTESGEYSAANRPEVKENDPLHYDPDASTKRGIPYYQKALDKLANTFAKLINEANTLNDKDIYRTNSDGKFLGSDGFPLSDADQTDKTKYVLKDGFEKYFQTDGSGNFLRESDGSLIFKDEYAKYKGGPLFSNNGNADTIGESGDALDKPITAANISVSHSWAHGQNHVLRSKDPKADNQSREQSNIDHIITLMESSHEFVNEEAGSKFEGTFQEMLTETIAGVLAKDENITQTMLNNYNTTADELYVDRDAVMGVDLNDEAMNMMQFQKAYSAACRLMTTYDAMLEKLINGTAV